MKLKNRRASEALHNQTVKFRRRCLDQRVGDYGDGQPAGLPGAELKLVGPSPDSAARTRFTNEAGEYRFAERRSSPFRWLMSGFRMIAQRL